LTNKFFSNYGFFQIQVFEAATVKTEAIKRANSSMFEAKAAVKRVLETIEQGKKNELTSENPSIEAADKVQDSYC